MSAAIDTDAAHGSIGSEANARHTRRGAAPAARGPRERFIPRAAAMLVMGVCTLYFLMPIWWLFVASTKDRGRLHRHRPRCGSPTSRCSTTSATLFAYRDGVFLRWMLNSVALRRRLGAARHPARRHVRLRPGEVPVPGPRDAVQRRARRRAGAGHRARPAAVPAVQPGRGDEHVLGGVPAEPGQPVRRLPCPDLRRGQRARRAARGGAASTAPARCAPSSRCRPGSCSRRSSRSSSSSSSPIWNNFFLPLIMLQRRASCSR